jgi:hypothetical protein
MCVKCWLNRTYSKSTLNCTCLALIKCTVRNVPYISVYSLVVTMFVTWYNIKSAFILSCYMHMFHMIFTIKSNIPLNSTDCVHNVHGLCFLWGRKWTCTYYVQFRLCPIPEYLYGWQCGLLVSLTNTDLMTLHLTLQRGGI